MLSTIGSMASQGGINGMFFTTGMSMDLLTQYATGNGSIFLNGGNIGMTASRVRYADVDEGGYSYSSGQCYVTSPPFKAGNFTKAICTLNLIQPTEFGAVIISLLNAINDMTVNSISVNYNTGGYYPFEFPLSGLNDTYKLRVHTSGGNPGIGSTIISYVSKLGLE